MVSCVVKGKDWLWRLHGKRKAGDCVGKQGVVVAGGGTEERMGLYPGARGD